METLTIILLLGFAIMIFAMAMKIGLMQNRINKLSEGNLNNWKEWTEMKKALRSALNSIDSIVANSDSNAMYWHKKYDHLKYTLLTLMEYFGIKIVEKTTPAKT